MSENLIELLREAREWVFGHHIGPKEGKEADELRYRIDAALAQAEANSSDTPARRLVDDGFLVTVGDFPLAPGAGIYLRQQPVAPAVPAEWNELPAKTLEAMAFLGNFGPIVRGGQVKGYVFDNEAGHRVKCYLDPSELREISDACLNVASWLESNDSTPGPKP